MYIFSCIWIFPFKQSCYCKYKAMLMVFCLIYTFSISISFPAPHHCGTLETLGHMCVQCTTTYTTLQTYIYITDTAVQTTLHERNKYNEHTKHKFKPKARTLEIIIKLFQFKKEREMRNLVSCPGENILNSLGLSELHFVENN